MPVRWTPTWIPFEPIESADGATPQPRGISNRSALLLLALTEQAHWKTRWSKEDGELTPSEVEAIEDWASQAEHELLEPMEAGGGETVPFWQSDDGSDASDDEPIETWYETASWWIITAFLATTVTPGAAIEYVTAVRTLHLAFKRGGFGGLIRALIDNVEVAQIDTYSAGTPLLEWVWDTGDEDPHTLRLELMEDANPAAEPDPDLGGYRMDVIRKNIRFPLPSFVNGTRYNDATDTIETTTDGGATWVGTPTADPRHQILQPILTTTDPRCDAAARMTAYVQELIDGVEDGLAAGALFGTVLSIAVGTVAPFFPLIYTFWFLIEALVTLIIDAGLADLQDSFTSTFYTQLEGYFYCALGADGALSVEGLNRVLAQVTALADVTKTNVFGALVNLLGEGGFNAIASTRTETGSCGGLPACTWVEYLYPGDAHVVPVIGGIFNASSVWRNHPAALNVQTKSGTLCWYWSLAENRRSVQLRLPLHLPVGCTLTEVAFYCRNLGGGNLDTVQAHVEVNYSTTVAGRDGTNPGSPFALTVSVTNSDVLIVCYMDENAAVKDFCIDSVRLTGTGVNPLY